MPACWVSQGVAALDDGAGSCRVALPYAHDGDFTFGWLGDLQLALTSSGGQNMTIGFIDQREVSRG
jgi:hypothetical protein